MQPLPRWPLHAAELLVLVIVLIWLVRRHLPRSVLVATSLLGLLALVVYTVADEKHIPYRSEDFHIFYHAGQAWRQRADPYTDANLLHPPSALPLFGLLSLVPEGGLQVCFVVMNTVGALVLPWLSWCALRAQGEEAPASPPGPALGLLGVAVALAQSSRYNVALGQLGILGAVAVVLALLAQGKGRPYLAAVALMVGHLKITTMLPVLLLFCRWRDGRTWLALGVGGILLALAGSWPYSPLRQCQRSLANIALQAQTTNAISYDNPSCVEIISVDSTLYRLGLRHPHILQVGQAVLLVALGVLLTTALTSGRMSRPTGCALVLAFSQLVLYHRFYDLVLLAFPLTLASLRTVNQPEGRGGHGLAALACLMELYYPVEILRWLTREFQGRDDLLGWVVQAGFLPYGCWLIVLVLVGLTWGEVASRGRPTPGT